jgi:peptidoglycan glycosyltransferase
VKKFSDLFTTRTVTDTVTLTVSTKLMQLVQQQLVGKNGAIVVLDPRDGAIRAMYYNPTFDPNPLAVNSRTTETKAFQVDNAVDPATGFSPTASLAYQDIFFPGSTFKTETTAAAYDLAPKLINASMPFYFCIPKGTFLGQTTQLCNSGAFSCGGTMTVMLPESCDTGYAVFGTRIGAAAMTAEADGFGFNEQPPIDLPHSPFEVSQFLQPKCYGNAQVFLVFSSIGQKCTLASPLQMAMVAATFANGGVMMSPHVMAEIRNSEGNLVRRYLPTP